MTITMWFTDELISEEVELEGKEAGYQDLSLEELTRLLEQAVGNEDYELAARIRDEISKRG